LVEHATENRGVASSILALGTTSTIRHHQRPAPKVTASHVLAPHVIHFSLEGLVDLSLGAADRAAIETLVASLDAAWNAGDGEAFAAPFAADADFVNIRGEHHQGRAAIAAGHAAILRTIYAGSTNRYTVKTARPLDAVVALVHVNAVLDVPSGPLAGRHAALFSMVLMRTGTAWQIASFHNTLQPPAGARG
jgi:uncharacterized protein (TIGR02246 family)